MPCTKTPLRYPGGKSQLKKFVGHIIKLNNLNNAIYCEPFSGGAGVAISLLLDKQVDSIILNDFDTAIYSVWYAITKDTADFLQRIETTDITIKNWQEQHEIYEHLRNSNNYSIELAFATLFLNRTNVSGIITGGPIGGIEQGGHYKLDCRYNKTTLCNKIQAIANMRDHIRLYHCDATDLIHDVLTNENPNRLFTFFDPPYYQQGNNLYKNAFDDEKHVELSQAIHTMDNFHWITTYDNHQRIQEIYSDMNIKHYSLQYTANKKRREKEIFFSSPITQVESFDKVMFVE